MNLEGTAKNIIGAAENHAMLLTFAGASYARAAEQSSTDPIGTLIGYLNPAQDPTVAGPIHEIMKSFSTVTDLRWKLLDSPHLSTQVGKFATAAWIVGKYLDVLPAKYTKLAGEIAKGAYASAILCPGSGPGDAKRSTASFSPTNQTPGTNNPTSRLIGN